VIFLDARQFQSALARYRHELALLAKSIIRFALWILVVVTGLVIVFVLFPPAGVMPGQTARSPNWAFAAMMVVWGFSIGSLTRSRNPELKTWIGIHIAIVGVGALTFSLLPQWSGPIMAAAFTLFVLAPNALGLMAYRRASGGYARVAVFYARLVTLLHPSRLARFQLSFLRARSHASTEEKVSAFRSLAERATPEQFALLNCHIAVAEDDWEGVLAQIRSSGTVTAALKHLEIRALGELGRTEEMLITYVWAESDLSPTDLLFRRLYVLAFTGHLDGVRSFFGRQLRFVRSRNKAYWIFIASGAAKTHDDDARRILASYVDTADDETFRRAAQRHLAEAPMAGGAVLSDEHSDK
jgi:hypothetical protein